MLLQISGPKRRTDSVCEGKEYADDRNQLQ